MSRVKGAMRIIRPLPLALTIGLAAAALPFLRSWNEQSARAALPVASADAPNIVLVVLDTVRADHLGFYGYDRATSPAIDALAARSEVFDRAISTSPWTLPGHARRHARPEK